MAKNMKITNKEKSKIRKIIDRKSMPEKWIIKSRYNILL